MLSEIVGVLLHPSEWSTADTLAPHQRTVLALAFLALTLVSAIVAALLSGRWGRKRATGAEARRRAASGQRALVLLVISIGGYQAVQTAPIQASGQRVLAGALYVVGAVVLAQLCIHAATLLVTTTMARAPHDDRVRFEREVLPLVTKVVGLCVGLVLVAVVARHFGQNITSLVAALGVGSLAIGLAAQQTLGHMIAGFVLLVDRPFRVGDRIQLSTGESGEVLDVGVRATRIRLDNQNLLIVPNADLVNNRVTNVAPAPPPEK